MVPASGFSWPVSMRKSVVLPTPFGPMTPTMPPGGSLKERFSISSRSPIALGQVLDVDDGVAEALARRNEDLRGAGGRSSLRLSSSS